MEIPEVYELLNVALVLTDDAVASGLVDPRTAYYQAVVERFSPHRSHPLIDALRASLGSFPSHRSLFAYRFDGEVIVHDGQYGTGWRSEASFAEYLPLLEDFARVSGFREFYAEHQPYYGELVDSYLATVPLDAMWNWLEGEFQQECDAYRVVISPLVGGWHNTFLFRDRQHDYHEIVMFVPAVTAGGSGTEPTDPAAQAMTARVVFTEIDHNYVNPATDDRRHLGQVTRVFADVTAWNTGPGYSTPGETFNEYMTWAVFSLWAREAYELEVFGVVNEATVGVMNRRGFVRFAEFNQALLDLYEKRGDGETVFDLYPKLLKWAERSG